MKILKTGEVPNQNKIICNACKTEFIYEQKDIQTEKNKRIEHHMTLGGVWDDYLRTLDSYIECPLCKKHFIVDSEIESIDTLTFSKKFNGETEAFERQIGWNN